MQAAMDRYAVLTNSFENARFDHYRYFYHFCSPGVVTGPTLVSLSLAPGNSF